MDYRHVGIFEETIMYTVKLKYKKSNEIMYSNESIIHERGDIRNGNNFQLKWFCLSLDKAKEIYKNLIFRNANFESDSYGWYEDKKLDYISIVELSNYEPYNEYQVVDYREFK